MNPPVKLSPQRSGAGVTLELDGIDYLDLTESQRRELAYWRIETGEDTVCQNQQDDIMGVYHAQQFRVGWKGRCCGGCRPSNLVEGLAVPISSEQRRMNSKMDRSDGKQTICRYTRLPCPTHELGAIVERYQPINSGA